MYHSDPCCLPGPTTRIGSGTQLIILAQNPRFVNSVIPGYTLVMPELFDPIFEKWQKEQAFLASQKEQHPELFIRTEGLEILEQLTRVGIVLPVQPLVKGFIKYHPFDFIVEERLSDGTIVSIDVNSSPVSSQPAPFFRADLVKVGISTIDAIRELARKLNIKETQVGYGGVKDAIALTSQRISVSKVSLDQLQTLPNSNFYLKNIQSAQEAMSMNNILGNRFTIFIRTQEQVDEEKLVQRLTQIQAEGFWNFYWLQRFGNRLLSHWWGLLLLQGKEEKTVRSYLCDPGPGELPFFSQLRKQANQQFGNWEEIIKLYEPFGFSLRFELLLLNYLKEFRHDYTGALRSISEQVKMWIYAYSSFVFNKVLSLAAADKFQVPTNLPLLLSNDPKDREVYRQFLEMDKIPLDFAQKIKRFDFIRFTLRYVETKLLPKILGYKILPEGVIISFDLPKGAYATTFLSHLFTLEGSLASVVNPKKYDLKQVLGTGTMDPALKKLEKFIVARESESEE